MAIRTDKKEIIFFFLGEIKLNIKIKFIIVAGNINNMWGAQVTNLLNNP